jgi:hypothetical protein
MMYPQDPGPQLYAYLLAWRQILEPLTAAMPQPGNPWSMPTMPPASPPLPGGSPQADYPQQLFGHLQAWRQHLEQMTGPRPAPAEPSDPQAPPATPYEGASAHTAGADGRRPVPPADPWGNTITGLFGGPTGTTIPPDLLAVAPVIQNGSQIPHVLQPWEASAQPDRVPVVDVTPNRLGQAAVQARGQIVKNPPPAELGRPFTDPGRVRRNSTDQRPTDAGAVNASSAGRQVSPTAQLKGAAPSRFKGLAERAALKIQQNGL